MTLYASKSFNGFIDEAVGLPGGVLPADAVVITAEERRALLAGQSAGKTIQFNTGASPTLLDPPGPNLFVYANIKQWALATGGYTVTVGGQALAFSTDGDSRSLLDGKVSRLGQANPPATVNWQFGATFVQIPAADFLAVAVEIADFVQSTFDALEVVFAQIEGGTITTTAEIDAYAWPSNVSTVAA